MRHHNCIAQRVYALFRHDVDSIEISDLNEGEIEQSQSCPESESHIEAEQVCVRNKIRSIQLTKHQQTSGIVAQALTVPASAPPIASMLPVATPLATSIPLLPTPVQEAHVSF